MSDAASTPPLDRRTGEPIPTGPYPGEDLVRDGLAARVAVLEAVCVQLTARVAIAGLLSPDELEAMYATLPKTDPRAGAKKSRRFAARMWRRMDRMILEHRQARAAAAAWTDRKAA